MLLDTIFGSISRVYLKCDAMNVTNVIKWILGDKCVLGDIHEQ